MGKTQNFFSQLCRVIFRKVILDSAQPHSVSLSFHNIKYYFLNIMLLSIHYLHSTVTTVYMMSLTFTCSWFFLPGGFVVKFDQFTKHNIVKKCLHVIPSWRALSVLFSICKSMIYFTFRPIRKMLKFWNVVMSLTSVFSS